MAALSGGEMCVKYLMFAFNLVFWVTEGVVNDNFLLPTHFLTYLFGFLPGKTLDNKCIYTEYFVCFMNMAVAGGIKCVKYLMFAFNFVFWLAGTAVFAIGLWLRLDPKTKGLFEGSDAPYVFYTGVYILIGAGALMMVVGFLGCCGAIQESPCMLGLFFFFLLIIFAIELAAGIWGFSNQSKVVNDITIFYKQTYNNYMVTGDERFKETLRVIHTGLNCCGPTGTMSDGAKDTCPRGEILELLITKSCPDAIDEVFDSKLHIIGGVGVTIGVIMMFGMIFSMLLCCAIRKSREVV